MSRIVLNGMVAVIVHPSWGGGWTGDRFDVQMVRFLLGLGPVPIYEYYSPAGMYVRGAERYKELVVQWVPINTPFYVHVYDGKEWITYDILEATEEDAVELTDNEQLVMGIDQKKPVVYESE